LREQAQLVALLTKMAQNKLKSNELIEELLQDVFLSLWEKRAAQTIENLSAYLFTALKYRIIDLYKKQILAEKYADFALTKNPSCGPACNLNPLRIIY